MSILVDQPRPVAFKQFKRTAHLASDTSVAELHAFATRIGLKRSWYQAGTRAHYDLFDGKIDKALAAGAELVSVRELLRRAVRE